MRDHGQFRAVGVSTPQAVFENELFCVSFVFWGELSQRKCRQLCCWWSYEAWNGQVTSEAGMSNSPTGNWLDSEQIQRLLDQGTSQQQLMNML